jgi:ABC-type lipoprotein release transport system permease subunit
MWLLKLAWKNLWRNKGRTLITVSAIFFAVILSSLAESLKQGIFDNLVKNVVSFYTGYLQVHKAGYQEEQILDNSFYNTPWIENKLKTDGNVTTVTPRLEAFALASSEKLTKGCLVISIDPAGEDQITSLAGKMVQGSYLNTKDEMALISEGLADRLDLSTGDTIILVGQGYHGSIAAGKYPIKGLVRFGTPQLNDRTVFLPLRVGDVFFGAEGHITSFLVKVKNVKQLDATAINLEKAVGKEYEVLTWGEILPDIKQHIATDSNNMKVVQGILYLLICFGIFSTMIMMMLERKYEMGMLVAIGMKKRRLTALFVMESVLTVLVGCIAGIAASIPIIYYFNKHPIRLGGEVSKAYERFGFEAIFPTATDPAILIYQGIVVLLIGLLLSIYPVIRVIRLDPVKAMKK